MPDSVSVWTRMSKFWEIAGFVFYLHLFVG